MRGTTYAEMLEAGVADISIHVPREGDDGGWTRINEEGGISIHVPREGDDQHGGERINEQQHFNPRPP